MKINFRLYIFTLVSALFTLQVFSSELIIFSCKTEGGSIYDIELYPVSMTGEVRYRWMGQDAFYDATIVENGEVIKGIAVWQSSRTGENRGRPFSFEIDRTANTLKDNSTLRRCL